MRNRNANETVPEWAVILAGGKSLRLGQDKAALIMGDKTLLARIAELAGQFCPNLCVSGRDPAPLGVMATWCPDQTQGLGPIGGIMTALERFAAPCLVLSCDLPFLDGPTLMRLLAAWRDKPPHAVMTTFEQAETGFIEALVAVYEPTALPVLKSAVANGCYKLSRAIPKELRYCHVYTEGENQPFFNLNTPCELQTLQKALNGNFVWPEHIASPCG